ncbi:DNA primase family protein [Streptomyces mirabilis]|uniref:DNA primase family protein n=1 Tax=Streptomyces mirabilis TaxID=68239 RepID=UPI003699F9BA
MTSAADVDLPPDDDMWGGEAWEDAAPKLRTVTTFPPPPRNARTMRTRDDIGNAQRLIDRYGPIVRWVLVKKGGDWAVYDGRRWAFRGGDTLVRTLTRLTVEDLPKTEAMSYSDEHPVDDKGKELPSDRDLFLAYVSKLRDHRVMGRAISSASSFPELHAQVEDFDSQRRWLNLPNGVLDTDKVQLRAHDPDLMLSKMFGVPYNPQAKAPVWERFLEMNIPDEQTRLYLQKAAGYTLSGLSNEKTLLYLYGPSDTGKSIFTGVMTRMFGEYGQAASDGALRARREGSINNDVDDMAGKRFVTTSESRPGEEMDEALVKRLTGRDDQRTRALYENNRTWTPECVIWVCSNQYPKITGDDDAIWTRIRVVPFLRQFLAGDPDRDERLEEKLHAEMEGIFAWAARGLQMYLKDGLAPPSEVVQAGEKFRSSADGVTAFVAEYAEDQFVTVEEDGWTPRTDLYEMYQRWCKESAMREPLRPSRFYARMDVSYRAAKIGGTRGYKGITIGPKQMAPAGWGRA